MATSLFYDEHGWLVIQYAGMEAPMLREQLSRQYAQLCNTFSIIAPPSSKRINDPEHWRNRAEEARTIAEQMSDRDAIATMLHVAGEYEDLAQKAECRGLAKNAK